MLLYTVFMTEKTHPVYVDNTRKKKVKAKAAEEGVSMKEIMQRLIDYGFELELYKLPTDEEADLENVEIPDEFEGIEVGES